MKRSYQILSLVMSVGLTAELTTAQPKPDPNENPTELIAVYRGELQSLGRFDDDGNFLRAPGSLPSKLVGASGITYQFASWMNGYYPHYEHRSGRFVRGTTVKSGVFVPEIGSTVLDIKEVNLKDPDRAVWNMPEMLPGYVAARIKKYGKKPAPQVAEPPKAGTPAGFEFIPFSKSHPKKPPKHARVIGDIVEFGHLSDEGEFIPDPDLPVFSRKGILGEISSDPWAVPRYYTLPRLDKNAKIRSKPTYEYRSGRLIRGDLHENGNFVPELGSKVIDFKDFDPETEPNRWIYNLPGTLKKRDN